MVGGRGRLLPDRQPPLPRPALAAFDNAAYRSVLGNQQRNWLLDGMASSNARVKVVFIPMTMAWYWSTGERESVLQSITDRVQGTVIFCAGDKHAGAFVQHADRVWELLASPLENPTKHKTPMKPGRALHGERDGSRALGRGGRGRRGYGVDADRHASAAARYRRRAAPRGRLAGVRPDQPRDARTELARNNARGPDSNRDGRRRSYG